MYADPLSMFSVSQLAISLGGVVLLAVVFVPLIVRLQGVGRHQNVAGDVSIRSRIRIDKQSELVVVERAHGVHVLLGVGPSSIAVLDKFEPGKRTDLLGVAVGESVDSPKSKGSYSAPELHLVGEE